MTANKSIGTPETPAPPEPTEQPVLREEAADPAPTPRERRILALAEAQRRLARLEDDTLDHVPKHDRGEVEGQFDDPMAGLNNAMYSVAACDSRPADSRTKWERLVAARQKLDELKRAIYEVNDANWYDFGDIRKNLCEAIDREVEMSTEGLDRCLQSEQERQAKAAAAEEGGGA